MEDDLLAAIARDPEDPEPYLVYADHLQSRSALRGELMTLQNGTEEHPGDHRISDAALDHVRANARYYLGELAPFVDDHRFLRLGWRCGFIASAMLTWNRLADGDRRRFEVSAERVLSSLLQLDSARFLTHLVVEPTHQLDAKFIGEVLAAHAPASLRELWIGPRDPHSALRNCELGELTLHLPHLRELRIHGHAERFHLELPSLHSLTVMFHGELGHPTIQDLLDAPMPNLERFHLWSPSTPFSAVAFTTRTDLVTLGDLGIINCAYADEICRFIAAGPMSEQLYRLSLAKGALTDTGVEVLLARRANLPNLATIDVSETFVSRAGLARLRTLATEVVARDLRTGQPRVLIPTLPHEPDS